MVGSCRGSGRGYVGSRRVVALMSGPEFRTIAEQLDDAETGEEFAIVIGGFFTLLDKARDEETQP